MHILVTGGAGFIGSHVSGLLYSSGHEVEILDNLSTGFLENLPPDLASRVMVRSIAELDSTRVRVLPEVVVHLAAIPSVEDSWKEPIASHDNNLSSTVRVINWCVKRGVRRLVLASSAAVYGRNCCALCEEMPATPISPYGLQKLCAEQYALLFSATFPLEVVALRLFNVYGRGQRAESQYAGVLSRFVAAFREDRDIVIFGDGNQKRDFVEVSDVACAIRAACVVELASPALICNVGTGVATSLLEIVGILRTLFPSWRGQVRFGPKHAGDVRYSRADVRRLRERLRIADFCTLFEGLTRLTSTSPPSP